jgi:SAM-dependent methyltransferase
MMGGVTVTAMERAVALLADQPAEPDTSRGYLDLLGDAGVARTGLVQALMHTTVVPRIYRRWWRPTLSRVAKGVAGPSMADERTMVREALRLAAGDTVLDVACGPGNFTRELGRLVGDGGLAVGIDASRPMLDVAVRDAAGPSTAYVRGDAVRLPFADGAFDAVCCFAALHLFAEPLTALDHMLRVLAPGGRIAILTSARAGAGPVRVLGPFAARAGGMRMFERDEITTALAERGAHRIRQRVFGAAQFVSAQTRVQRGDSE